MTKDRTDVYACPKKRKKKKNFTAINELKSYTKHVPHTQ